MMKKINIKNYKMLEQKARLLKFRHDNECDNVFDLIKTALHEDILNDYSCHVFQQSGDGLVLVHDQRNIPVESIINYYNEHGCVLEREDLRRLAI